MAKFADKGLWQIVSHKDLYQHNNNGEKTSDSPADRILYVQCTVCAFPYEYHETENQWAYCPNCGADMGGTVQEAFEHFHVADMVSVVRCHDCVKRYTNDCAMYLERADKSDCCYWNYGNDFCSWGEKKTEEAPE